MGVAGRILWAGVAAVAFAGCGTTMAVKVDVAAPAKPERLPFDARRVYDDEGHTRFVIFGDCGEAMIYSAASRVPSVC